MTSVPCSGCTLCCQSDLIVLHPELGDDPKQYRTTRAFHPFTGEPIHALERKPDGSCIYLTKDGCSIHGKAPAICREYDCRRLYKKLSRQQRRQYLRKGLMTKEMLDRGRELLPTLEDDDD